MIKDIISNYFIFIFFPTKIHRNLTIQESNLAPFLGPSKKVFNIKILPLTFLEIISISWFFIVISALYSIFTINFSLMITDAVMDKVDFANEFITRNSINLNRINILFLLFTVILFPIKEYIVLKIWVVFLRFFYSILGFKNDQPTLDEKLNQVVAYSAASNAFLLLPVIGSIFKFFARPIYLFIGIKYNLKLSTGQSILAVISPFLLISALFVVFIIFLAILVQLLSIGLF